MSVFNNLEQLTLLALGLISYFGLFFVQGMFLKYCLISQPFIIERNVSMLSNVMQAILVISIAIPLGYLLFVVIKYIFKHKTSIRDPMTKVLKRAGKLPVASLDRLTRTNSNYSQSFSDYLVL